MIRLLFGNVGSGKTASMVYEMVGNPQNTYITNIKMYGGKQCSHIIELKPEMIINKEVVRYKKDDTPVHKFTLNTQFWKDIHNKYSNINVVIDEAHIFFNPRRSMSSLNIIMTDYMALLRRVLGTTDNTGDLVLITQLQRRLDIIAKETSNEISYFVNHYILQCVNCGLTYYENNERAEKIRGCYGCGCYKLKKIKCNIEVYKFSNMTNYNMFMEFGSKTYYSHFMIKDIETVFNLYDTLQWDDMFTDFVYSD